MQGLSSSVAFLRLQEEGFNELPSSKKRTIFQIAWDVVKEPMFLMLLACGSLYLISGELQEACMLLGFVFVVMGITLYQEHKTERALEALRDLSSPRALVIRDGQKIRIPGREVVRGDMVLLAEGDRVPADAVLRDNTNLLIDESLLTGESVSVRKSETQEVHPHLIQPGGDDSSFVYSGTLIVQGHGIAEVLSVGKNMYIGQIGQSLQILKEEETPLQKQTAVLVKTFAVVGLVLCLIVIIVFGVTRHQWLDGFLAGLSLAMSLLPEEFPVVMTIFLALGAWRISKNQVLTRRVPAIETIGATTVLCVDKTGTLTMNRMTASDLYAHGEFIKVRNLKEALPEQFHEVLEYCMLASPADPFDPMEKAMKELGEKTLQNTEHLHRDWELLKEYSLSKELLAMSRVWRSREGDDYIIAAKGAPEAIADLCHFSSEEMDQLKEKIVILTNQGRRVIGVAVARFHSPELPEKQHDFKFVFLGLIGLEDPVRPGVSDALKECYCAGVRTIMITGDYPGTAVHIAQQIELQNPKAYITGSELALMDDMTLQEKIKKINIFARMIPEQKLRLVQALKNNGEIVAMTGDGVNDAPALKAAHIGIAMGGRGTDVAREASSIVLLDDDFSSIVKGIRMGRRIFDNLKKAMQYIFSVHIPIAGLSLFPVLLNWPLALYPVHIVFLELIIDPACSIVFEAEKEENDVMKRPPRQISEPLFTRAVVLSCLFQGLWICLIVVGVYRWAMLEHSINSARALAFIPLVLSNLGLIFSNRFYTKFLVETFKIPNKALWWVTSGTLLLLFLIMVIPFGQQLFHFEAVQPLDIAICVIAGIICIGGIELLKLKKYIRSK